MLAPLNRHTTGDTAASDKIPSYQLCLSPTLRYVNVAKGYLWFSLKRLKGFVLADRAGKFNSDVNFCVSASLVQVGRRSPLYILNWDLTCTV
jgi:hypothetical protein